MRVQRGSVDDLGSLSSFSLSRISFFSVSSAQAIPGFPIYSDEAFPFSFLITFSVLPHLLFLLLESPHPQDRAYALRLSSRRLETRERC